MSEPQTPLLVRVARKHTEALDICSLDLVAEPGHTLPGFSAGAHIDVALPNGLVRQYSLCNPPGETGRYQIAVLRDAASRGGSQAVHEAVAEGSTLHISAPKNHFPLATDAAHHLLLAGGIGITPLLAMAERLTSQGECFELHHCTRSRDRTPFLERVAASAFARQTHHHFDDGEAVQKLDIAATLQRAPAGTHLYVCGPQGFMDGADHRKGLSPIYNFYSRCSADDPPMPPAFEDAQLIVRPLFTTAFLCADFLQAQSCFGARRIVNGRDRAKMIAAKAQIFDAAIRLALVV